ncbi:hypothetical protein M433DRAFT_319411 [Acidomyces richmondensis BFW]|nr:MAG: hypothetical protein FE78DRAFT_72584 [Acidomyces sp. 'richmondensis']KYG44142.1 hypothetical protein M433DRAFT_319411 [Acidomyces richmondensis BFW]
MYWQDDPLHQDLVKNMSLRQSKSIQHLSRFVGKFFYSRPEQTEGLYWLSIWSCDGSLESATFNDVLNRLVLPLVMKDEEVMVVFKLRNTSPAARGGNSSNDYQPVRCGPYVLAARLRDIQMLCTSSVLQSLAINNRNSQDSRSFRTQVKTWELVQRYEPKNNNKMKGTCMVAVFITPAQGQEQEIDDWYRKDRIPLLVSTPVVIRCTRYRLRPGILPGCRDDGPTSLCLHECVSTKDLLDYAIQHGQIFPETDWSKRIFDSATHVERTIWDITGKYQQADLHLDKL